MDDLMETIPEQVVSKSDDEYIQGHIYRDTSKIPKPDLYGILDKFLQVINVADILKTVKDNAEYVVQVPEEFISALKSGDVWMMENSKNGKMWPTLMRAAENGKNEIVTPLQIKRQEFIQGNPIQELSSSFHNIYVQQQMQAMSEIIEESLETAKRIERGQKTDRMGLLESGRDQIFLALSQTDEEDRKQDLRLARKSISDGFGQILMVLQDKVVSFEPILESRFKRILQMAWKSSYFVKKDCEYTEIQEYLNLYIQATRMWAASFALVGDTDGAARVFELSESRLKSIDFENLKTIAYIHQGEDFEKIYSHTGQYITIEKKEFDAELQEDQGVAISISGDKLLEMISDGRKKEISEQEAEH